MEWQPIETAPKDLTEVLVVLPDGVMAVARCDELGWEPGKGITMEGYEDLRGRPTHWMPLPEPPVNDAPETPAAK